MLSTSQHEVNIDRGILFVWTGGIHIQLTLSQLRFDNEIYTAVDKLCLFTVAQIYCDNPVLIFKISPFCMSIQVYRDNTVPIS